MLCKSASSYRDFKRTVFFFYFCVLCDQEVWWSAYNSCSVLFYQQVKLFSSAHTDKTNKKEITWKRKATSTFGRGSQETKTGSKLRMCFFYSFTEKKKSSVFFAIHKKKNYSSAIILKTLHFFKYCDLKCVIMILFNFIIVMRKFFFQAKSRELIPKRLRKRLMQLHDILSSGYCEWKP